ncbi:MAG: glutathione S-transferase N-terminal domain-containing protein [Patescibacteria group bacterium]
MLILYMRPGCPYCARVFKAAEELTISFDERNINEPGINAELLARGGKRQVPYLVDTERGVEMYESEDIIKHLHATFTKKT